MSRWSKLGQAGRAAILLVVGAGCTVAERRPPVLITGDPVRDAAAQRAAAPEKDRVLWDYRYALAALRTGQYEAAAASLDEALRVMEGTLSGPDAAAARSRGLFTPEAAKTFVGEPYERAMAYYYRGLLYVQAGEWDNARACFRSAQLIDSAAEEATHRSDYILLDYLEGLTTARLGGDGSDALARAAEHSIRTLPPYDKSANVVVFAEYGSGPRKYAAGESGEELRFRTTDSRVRAARLTIDGQVYELPPWDDLNFQATTRGGRVMDYILDRKAVFKESADAAGDIALAGAVIASSRIYKPVPPTKESTPAPVPARPRRRPNQPDPPAPAQPTELEKDESAERAAILLGVVGILGKVVAAAATPQADTRTWDNLPQYLSFAALTLPEGEHPARLEFFDGIGNEIPALSRTLTIAVPYPEDSTFVFLSEPKR